ncbi:Alpha/Beta hydrolase protein [Gamsiella multidivaricata]|uniref:Alpha/Beta hydrolase protein n=1 Tax=Gamsiella multidivaricata TaxID=101098 RepID=UPI00221F2EA5|nr:Alpha/Beta hydrolase protein [Gamsiella multidivaricata]KAI7830394.1 Alpha/Beta hydrolase protein [Gamsiella multidivaricata]
MGLAKHLHPEQPLYGLQARGLDGKTPLAGSVEEMTLDYIEHIRKIQPHGPYHLLGWSFGGSVAQSIAVELEKQGEKVPLLVIMDSTADYSMMGDVEVDEQDGSEQVEHLARFGSKDSTEDGWALWKRTMPIIINNKKLAKRFTPSVYSGDILFFRATIPQDENTPLVDSASWKPYTLGKVEVHDVECTHLEMDKPENIALIGGIVAAKIEGLLR